MSINTVVSAARNVLFIKGGAPGAPPEFVPAVEVVLVTSAPRWRLKGEHETEHGAAAETVRFHDSPCGLVWLGRWLAAAGVEAALEYENAFGKPYEWPEDMRDLATRARDALAPLFAGLDAPADEKPAAE